MAVERGRRRSATARRGAVTRVVPRVSLVEATSADVEAAGCATRERGDRFLSIDPKRRVARHSARARARTHDSRGTKPRWRLGSPSLARPPSIAARARAPAARRVAAPIAASARRLGRSLASRSPSASAACRPRAVRIRRHGRVRRRARGRGGAEGRTDAPRWDARACTSGTTAPNSANPWIDKDLDAVEADVQVALKADFEGKLATRRSSARFERVRADRHRAHEGAASATSRSRADTRAGRRRRAEAQGELCCSGTASIAGQRADVLLSLELADLRAGGRSTRSWPSERREAGQVLARTSTRRAGARPYQSLSKAVERALTVRAPFAGKGKVVEFYGNELSRLRFEDPTAKEGAEPAEVNMEVLLAKMTEQQGGGDSRVPVHADVLNDGSEESFERVAALSLNMVAGELARRERRARVRGAPVAAQPGEQRARTRWWTRCWAR